jgi:hypothetical protein
VVTQDGELYSVPLPEPMTNLWPLPEGVLLMVSFFLVHENRALEEATGERKHINHFCPLFPLCLFLYMYILGCDCRMARDRELSFCLIR